MATNQEAFLLAQIKELNRQLAIEKARKKKASKQQRNISERLLWVGPRLPAVLEKNTVDIEGLVVDEWNLKAMDWDAGNWLGGSAMEGGLLTAFAGLKTTDVWWVGWPGWDVEEEDKDTVKAKYAENNSVPVFIDDNTIDLFYHGFANSILWPLFHYVNVALDEADSLLQDRWEAYKRANQMYADVILSQYQDGDLVWIQDYHLILVPQYLRAKKPDIKIGFFLQAPWPSSEIYRMLPQRKEILQGLLGCDLIGFHVYEYASHFLNACWRILGMDFQYPKATYDNHTVTLGTFPFGLDPARYLKTLEETRVKEKIIEYQRTYDGKKIILSLDRLGYIKGIPHKLRAMEKFLTMYPEWRSKVVMIQIAIPNQVKTPESDALCSTVHELVGRINGTHGTLGDVPIHYFESPIEFEESLALFSLGDVCMVTSLRDGANIVPYEFVVCQQKTQGVLILSEFTSASQGLGAGSLIINPFNTAELANAIGVALSMPKEERAERHEYMYHYVEKNTLQFCAECFVSDLREANYNAMDTAIPDICDYEKVQQAYTNSGTRLILLGVLGTLTTYGMFKRLDILPKSVKEMLTNLASDEKNTVVIVSGRGPALLNEWMGNIPHLWLAAENGSFLRFGGRDLEWENLFDDRIDTTWLEEIIPIFKYFEERTPGSFTEVQEGMVTWHFKHANTAFGRAQANALQVQLSEVLSNLPAEVVVGEKRIEVRNNRVSKGVALERILDHISQDETCEGKRNIDFVLCIGDLYSRDEDMFQLMTPGQEVSTIEMPENTFTCSVGKSPSQASHYVNNVTEVSQLLGSLAQISLQDSQMLEQQQASTGDVPGVPEIEAPPCALEEIHNIVKQITGRDLAFFLDYDGTLTPIVQHADEAILSDDTREVVRALATKYHTSIVTGRSRVKAHNFVQLDDISYAGSHGFDIAGPANTSISHQVASSYIPALDNAKNMLPDMLKEIDGAWVEDNTFSVSVHFRNVAVENVPKVESIVDDFIAESPMLRKTYGKKVLELRPQINWHKGKAVEWLLDALEMGENAFPVYIGDDVTDEDAFRTVKERNGLAIIVSEDPKSRPTEANYCLHSPVEVREFLRHFVNLE
eukprot:GFYU01007662.1.p1 GENE.GFYU01007662.1~~GFYU01007662.1.p1  ORF type:complete len:1120 (+),score=348.98 GFYU01007662.1:67-3360(+)